MSNTVRRRLRHDCSWRQDEYVHPQPQQQPHVQQARHLRQALTQELPDVQRSQHALNRASAEASAHDPAIVRQLEAIDDLERRLVAIEAFMAQHESKQEDLGGALVARGEAESTMQPKVYNLESKVLEMAASLTELRQACMQHAAVLAVVLHRDSSGKLKQYAQDHCDAALAAGSTVQSVFQPSTKIWQELPLERENSFWYVASAGKALAGDDTSTCATSSGKSCPAGVLNTSLHTGDPEIGPGSAPASLCTPSGPGPMARNGSRTEANLAAMKEAAPPVARTVSARGRRPTLKQLAAASSQSYSGPATRTSVGDDPRTYVHIDTTDECQTELSIVFSHANQHTMGVAETVAPPELELGANGFRTDPGSEAVQAKEEMPTPSAERMPSAELAEGLEGGRMVPLDRLGLGPPALHRGAAATARPVATSVRVLSGEGLNRSLTTSSYAPTMGLCGECSCNSGLPPNSRPQAGFVEALGRRAQGHGG